MRGVEVLAVWGGTAVREVLRGEARGAASARRVVMREWAPREEAAREEATEEEQREDKVEGAGEAVMTGVEVVAGAEESAG